MVVGRWVHDGKVTGICGDLPLKERWADIQTLTMVLIMMMMMTRMMQRCNAETTITIHSSLPIIDKSSRYLPLLRVERIDEDAWCCGCCSDFCCSCCMECLLLPDCWCMFWFSACFCVILPRDDAVIVIWLLQLSPVCSVTLIWMFAFAFMTYKFCM